MRQEVHEADIANRHIQNHVKSKQYTCPTCHVSFYRRDLLSRHSKMHKSHPSPPAAGTQGRKHVQTHGNQGRQRCHTARIPCRESRTKCDGSQPCLSCVSSGKTCKYSHTINRISRAPLNRGPALPVPASQQTARNENSTGDDCEQSLGSDQDWIARQQECHLSYTNSDLTESNGLLLSPAASSDAPPFANDPSMQQRHVDPLSQPFQNGGSSLGDPNLSVGMIDSLVSDLASDAMAWPWLHESLFLPAEYPEPWPEIHEQNLIDENSGRNSSRLQGNEIARTSMFSDNMRQNFHSVNEMAPLSQSASTLNRDSWQQRREAISVPTTRDSSPSISVNPISAVDSQQSESPAAAQNRIVDEIVTQAVELGSLPATKTGRATHWQIVAMKVQNGFKLQSEQPQQSSHALQHFIDLYLQHFGPLWPLISRQNLDYDLLHPLLYLTLTSIGAMYGGIQSAHFGTLIHCRLRQSLTTGLEFGEPDEDLVWLAQARLLTQVNALYFGQSQAFSYAQHLGGILVAQARRMNLFKAQRCRSDDSISESQRTTSERLTRWLYLEARRRLAFGILRAKTYTSVLLNTRPLVSPEEIDLEVPYADSTWRGPQLPPDIYLAMVDRDRASRLKQRFSDVVRISSERDEVPSALDPLGNELLLFGLQQLVWRFSHDHSIFLRLTGSMESTSQLGHDGLDTVSVSAQVSARSTSSISTILSNATPTSPIPEDHLRGSPKRMHDLQTDLDRLIAALQKWKESLKLIRNGITLQQERNSVLSSLLLYHLSYIRLQAPVEDMHYVSYRIVDKRPVEKQILKDVCEWANSRRASITVQHASIIWSLIILEMRRPEENRAKFNFLAFAGLHHAAVTLWTFMGANNGVETQKAYFIEALVDSEPKIAVTPKNSRAILLLFSQVFNLVGPGRWSSFGAAALKLSDCHFPSANK
ncbi:hypothetical protein EG329_002492 [Mollisiaceae sp. DMI_Dod_QoI]|nr:hypothetical protein EG329_002492 [Helotiales sp. DMI_Dod_QoI]